MKFKLVIDSVSPEIEVLIVTEIINAEDRNGIDIIREKGIKGNACLYDKDKKLLAEGTNEINRYLARTINTALYGGTCPRDKTEVDHWMLFAIEKFADISKIKDNLNHLNRILITRTWLVNKRLTLADIYIFCALLNQEYIKHYGENYDNITRWYKHVQSLRVVKNALHMIVKDVENYISEAKNIMPEKEKSVTKQTKTKKQEGKFIDLPGAEMGKVVVRFPPEASGYLHIGHAKAALLNQYYAETFQGMLIMRFDDTNPAKETVEFEEAILQDLKLLQIKPHKFTHTSDYFEILEEYCTTLIVDGKAFVDDTPAHIMKEQRDKRLKSENRDNSVKKNFQLWQEMRNGTKKGLECCVRAKIDYESTNGCMRDPTIYRCKLEPHPCTGYKHKVYPTYDFACPTVDVIEHVTHTLRTTEYHDRDAQFYWILEALGLRHRPHIWEYSRLNMTYTVLSKRKLTWFVNEGLVDGWDDPRFPTVRGILRRGMTVEGLKHFIIAQGSSKSVVFMEWDKIWAFNKKVIDPVAIRYTALDYDNMVTVNIIDAQEGSLDVQNHPKDPSKGTKRVRICSKVLIERDDAKALVVGQNATFINWGNLMIEKIDMDQSGNIVDVKARLNLTDNNYKNTLKITWIAAPLDKEVVSLEDATELNPIPCYAVYFNHIMNVSVLGKDDDFKDFVAKDTRKEVKMWGEVELKRVKKGEIIQLQRKGFFICDVPYAPTSLYSLREQPLILFHIPDGHTTTSSVTTSAVSLKQQRDVVQHKIACEKTVESKKKLAWNSDIKSTKEVNLPLLQNLEDYERGIDKTRSLLLDIIQYQENKIKQLKSVYKEITGQDWEQIQITSTDTVSNTKIKAISEQLNKQINKMQNLVNSKADKSIIDKEMKIFLSSANDYQNAIDREWKLTEITAADSVSNTKTKEISQTKEMSKKMQNHLRVLENIIDRETKNLSNLKAEYQSVTGQNSKPSQITTAASSDTTSKDLKEAEMSEEIKKQGDILRILKSSKADKSIIDKEVKILLNLKNDYKNATGQDWKPSQITTAASSDTTSKATLKEAEISEEIKKQGDTVRNLKISKADKSIIDREVKILLSLKNDYKNATGQDWKPSQITTTASSDTTSEETSKGVEISEEIRKQGDKVRNLKSSKADKSIIDREVKILLSLKNDYKNATGQDWKPSQITTAASSDTTSKDLKEAEMSEEIKKQGDILRNLKSSKADKSIIDREVKILSSLKNDYKNATGKDWKPSQITTAASSDTTSKDTLKEAEISEKIEKQGDKVRNLKSSKADKSIIDREVKILLSLKNDYKNATDQDWKPSQITTVASSDTTSKDTLKGVEISEEIKKQGDKVRNLKSSKADKSIIDREVKILLSLKNDYKNATGQDWKPSQITTAASSDTTSKDTLKEAEISEEIKKQGDKVRNLKSSKADKSIIDREVKILLSLKNDYKNATDQDWKPASNLEVSKKKKEDASKPGKMLQKEIAKSATSKDIDANKTGTRLGLEAKKEENFFDWYSQVITKSGMIEYYDVSGCYILRPWSFAIWKIIKEYIDKEITALGVQECYFPMFVTRGVLEKEKAHIADFAPEVAWVTKCGESDLAEPIAIRPTSETVMYPAYAKWLRSDTELPLRLNQWNNVVRWEFKDPKPFLRTREFLWQEGHTAFATKAEAEEEVLIILDMYAKVYEHLLAIPVIKGRKTEKEKFAGGDYTTTVEAFISTSGRAIQGATSHHLGQNFSKMFSIQLEGVAEGDEKTFIYQNSWGLTTRTIGVMIMVHGDDKGLVLPPHVASIQGIVIPCGVTANMSTTEKELLQSECVKLVDELSKDGKFRVKGDFRNNRTPGWKFNHWELKGVPVRIELGPKDMEKNQVTFVRRDNLQKMTAERKMVAIALDCLLKDIQAQLFYRAKENLTAHIKQVENWTDFGTELNKKNLLLSPFCGEPTCEDNIKADSAREDSGDELGTLSMGAKGLCIPFEQPKLTKPLDRLKCIHHSCKNKVKFYTLFGRSY